jgi:hypothetical protein
MSFLAAVKMVLTLSCDESTRLTSMSMDRDLSRSERVAVRLHAVSCRACRRFRRQIQFIRDAIRGRLAAKSVVPFPGPSLTPEARKRLKHIVAQRTREDSF